MGVPIIKKYSKLRLSRVKDSFFFTEFFKKKNADNKHWNCNSMWIRIRLGKWPSRLFQITQKRLAARPTSDVYHLAVYRKKRLKKKRKNFQQQKESTAKRCRHCCLKLE